jgi:hypothetical protein
VIVHVPTPSVVTTPVVGFTEQMLGAEEAYVIPCPEVLDAVIAIIPPLLYVAVAGLEVGDVTVIVSAAAVIGNVFVTEVAAA